MKQGHPNDSLSNFSKGCKLITFIMQLFSEAYADKILNCILDNLKSSTTFSEVFKNAVVHFTHFGKMADDSGTATYAVFVAFVRCMAFMTWSSQEVVNLLLPVLLMPREMLEESVITAVLIQVCKKKGSVNAYMIDQKRFGFFPDCTGSTTDQHPYVALIVELGVLPPTSPDALTETRVKDKIKSGLKQSVSVPEIPKKHTLGKRPNTPSTF